jgi:hypothetical protein
VWYLLSFGYQNAFDATSIMLSFSIHQVSRDQNIVVNDLAQQASGFLSDRDKCMF